MEIRLQHISIPRPFGEESAQLARRFYGELVGLTEKPVPDSIAHLGLVWFKIGEEAELHVFSDSDERLIAQQHFCLQIGNVEAMRETLGQSGYELSIPEEIPGRPRFFCRDPFNNLVEFTQIVDNYLKYQQDDKQAASK